MSSSEIHFEAVPGTALAVADPRRNPSYPARIHWGERAHWTGILEGWKAKAAEVAKKVAMLDNHPDREKYRYLYAQIQGGLDQVSDCVRRLPGEAGGLYEEDRHRIEQADQALKRLFARWEKGV